VFSLSYSLVFVIDGYTGNQVIDTPRSQSHVEN